jgi:hypothetical protein
MAYQLRCLVGRTVHWSCRLAEFACCTSQRRESTTPAAAAQQKAAATMGNKATPKASITLLEKSGDGWKFAKSPSAAGDFSLKHKLGKKLTMGVGFTVSIFVVIYVVNVTNSAYRFLWRCKC